MRENEIIVLKSNIVMRDLEVEVLEKELSKKFGKKVIILDGKFLDLIQIF